MLAAMRDSASKRSGFVLPLIAGVMLSALAAYLGWTLGSAADDRPVVPESADEESYPAILTEFRLPSLDGTEIGPRDFAGQIVVVDFWATWCAPCKVQARILEPIWEDLRGQGAQFLAVSMGESRETVEKYIEDFPYPYPVLYDTPDLIANEADIYALPTVMVIGKDGQVVYLEPGLSDAGRLRKALERAGL